MAADEKHLGVALASLLVGVAFYLSARLGLYLSFPPDYIAVFWPPNTVILAALLLTRPRKWWGFFLAMVPAYFIVAFQAGYSEQRAVIFFAAVVAPLVSACVASFESLLLVWITGGTSWLRTISPRRCIEAAVLAISLVAVGFFVFGGEIGAAGNLPVLVYLPLPLLFLAGLIEERKQAGEELSIQRYYLAKAQELGSIGTWELDIKKDELIWTDENYRIFGLPSGAKLTYENFLTWNLTEKAIASVQRVLPRISRRASVRNRNASK